MRFMLTLLLPCSVLAGGSVSVFIKDLGAVQDVNLGALNIQGSCDSQITESVSGKATYMYNKSHFTPSGLSLTSRTDTNLGKLQSTLTVDPQAKIAAVEASLASEQYGIFSTSYKAVDQKEGVFGPLRWTSKPMALPVAAGERIPMVISASHDVKSKEGFLSVAGKLNSNLDGKITLPTGGDAVVTLIGSHSPDEKSDVRVSASVLDLLHDGVGKGAVGVTYRRDLDAVPGSSSRVTLEGKDTGDFAWSLSNTTKRMTLVLSGRGRFEGRGSGGSFKPSTVSLRQSFRLF